jgi:hypothetical protein
MQEVSVSEQLHADTCSENTGEVRPRGKFGSAVIRTFQTLEDAVRSDVKVWLDVEHTGKSTEFESNGSRVVQWRWVPASSVTQAVEIRERQAKRQTNGRRDFIESI